MARQARGMRRIEQILDAAAALLAAEGEQGLTMNAIAREAGISPGSLYQFFPGRTEILAALDERYSELLSSGLPALADAASVREAPLAELLDRALDPVIAFAAANPGFRALFAAGSRAPVLGGIDLTVEERVLGLVAARAPGLRPADARRIARVSVRIVKGLLPEIAAAPRGRRAPLVRELKLVLERYLGPYDGTR